MHGGVWSPDARPACEMKQGAVLVALWLGASLAHAATSARRAPLGMARAQPLGACSPPLVRGPRARPRAAARCVALPAAAQSSVADVAARSLGWAVTAGSLTIYLPILIGILRRRSARGLSLSTWALQLCGYAAALVYPVRKRFPPSAYFETVALGVQSVLVLGALVALEKPRGWPLACAACALVLCACALGVRLAPLWALTAVQAAAAVSVNGALIPQLVSNVRRRSSGGWSVITAALSTAGNGARVFTSVQLTSDWLLVAGFCAGFALNAAMLSTTLLYDVEPAQSAPAGGAAEE